MKKTLQALTLSIAIGFLAGCGVQSIPQALNGVEAALAEITNQYKRRSDLIPNLVKTVKGYTKHEKETLEAVVKARSKATQVKIDPSNLSPSQIKKFQAAQGQLSSSLSRLLLVVEKYPNLKANQNFRDLQAQLEGTENRIAIARQRYIKSIQVFNNQITVPPKSWTNSMFYQHKKMPQWDVASSEKEQVKKTPEVNF